MVNSQITASPNRMLTHLHSSGFRGSPDYRDMLWRVFLPEPNCECLRIETDCTCHPERGYLSSCRHFVNLLHRHSEDLRYIANSKCLVLSFDDLNQFHGLLPICTGNGKEHTLHLESCGSGILRRIKKSVNWRSGGASNESQDISPTLLANCRQAIYEAKEPALTFAKASLE